MTALPFPIQMKRMPFVRLLIALTAGILLQWYVSVSLLIWFISFAAVSGCFGLFFVLPSYQQFRLQWLRGVLVLLLLTICGGILCFVQNPHHQTHHYTNVYQDGDVAVATISEPLVIKNKTYKATATVTAVYHKQKCLPVTGSIIVYFEKQNINPLLGFGSQIVFTRSLQTINPTGNPAAFDYARFLLFQGITAQVYLKSNEYKIVQQQQAYSLQSFLNGTRSYVIKTIQIFIPNKKESGVAEALLIGYRNDLDKQLVQSYSNTGVVHIIAISGLHLGMIYGFVLLLFSSFKNKKWYRFVVPVVALVVLWLFTLLAGAVPSILRSAVTFSFIAFGMFINRKTNIYNTLAASAFCLLVFNPFLLWDVGFQLSYAAVISILLFTKPISNCVYFQNKALNKLWQLSCVNIAAQIFTLPLVLYYFHQFPLLFLFNNLLVIPLSEIILFIVVLLVAIGKFSLLAILVGKISGVLLWLMNTIIERTEKIPFSLLSNIKVDVVQALLLYIIIVLLAVWLLYKLPRFFMYALSLFFVFVIYISVDVWKAVHQHKLIVYNINQHTAVDIVSGKTKLCFYDNLLQNDTDANNFYLKPARIALRVKNDFNQSLSFDKNWAIQSSQKTILILSQPLSTLHFRSKTKADIIIITNSAKPLMSDLQKAFDCSLIVADNSIPVRTAKKWKQDCDSFRVRFHSIPHNGALVLDL